MIRKDEVSYLIPDHFVSILDRLAINSNRARAYQGIVAQATGFRRWCSYSERVCRCSGFKTPTYQLLVYWVLAGGVIGEALQFFTYYHVFSCCKVFSGSVS